MTKTALGRYVPIEEWGEVAKDQVLKVLHDFRMSPFNPKNQPLDPVGLANAAGLPPNEATAFADALAEQHPPLVERTAGRYRITGTGVAYVHQVAAQAMPGV